jgi:glyoxylase-like metal-dependent hydrolase (beta-lactamase superfamily II)
MLDDVRLLSAGYCTHVEAMTLRGAPWRTVRFPSGLALLHHSNQGWVLFDTGYSVRFHAETRSFPGSLYARMTPVHLEDAQTARSQLAAAGILASDVREIVLSHFHADHVAGVRDFAAARIWCSRAAWESVRNLRGLRAVLKGFLPALLPDDIESRLQFIEGAREIPLSAPLGAFGSAYDLFGDGSALALALPGHVRGHIGLYLPATPHGPTFLIGDAAWSNEAVASCVPPPRITTAFLGETRAYRATLSRLSALRRSAPEIAIVPSHAPIDPAFALQ